MYYKRFEDIPVWQEVRIFINLIFSTIENSAKLKRDYSLCDQLRRASYSISLNIAEGFERGSNKDFAHFVNISKASAGETRAILYILLDNNFINQIVFDDLNSKIVKISCDLANFRKYLKSNKYNK